MSEHQKTRNKRISMIAAVIILLLLLFWRFGSDSRFWGSPDPQLVIKTRTAQALDELIGPMTLLIAEGTPLKPLQRPVPAMPVFKQVFEDVEVFMDGMRLDPGQKLKCHSGQQIKFSITAKHNEKIPRSMYMSAGGIGLACRAENKLGWMIYQDQYFSPKFIKHDSHAEGVWTVPDLQGEGNLVVLGDLSGSEDNVIFIRIVRSYPIVIE